MSLLSLIVLIVVVGLVLWLITFLPIPDPFKQIITVLATVCIVVVVIAWLLRLAGLGGL